MLAAYCIPRLFTDALRFTWESKEYDKTIHRLARVLVWVLALGGIAGVVVGLFAVIAAGVSVPI
jgi:hypothetical protein